MAVSLLICFFFPVKRRITLNTRKVELKKAFARGEMDPRGRMAMNMNMNMGMPMGRGGKFSLCANRKKS